MQIALVTGGSRGIGRAVCVKFAQMGYHVLINYNSNKDAAGETLRLVQDAGASGELLPFDVGDADAVMKALEEWKKNNQEKYIAILVNNAGIRKDNLLVWMNKKGWEDVINTNLNSLYYVTQPLIQDMMVNKFGRIVNVVSLSGLKGMPGQINYAAAKAGVIGATKSLAQEVGKKNVVVNAVAPGFIRTDMTADMDEKEFKKMIPLNRFGTAEEVADVVGFLAQETPMYVTGEIISINGGLYT
jgi:3-oxoacyl-[acyl-carrier protein] reductase